VPLVQHSRQLFGEKFDMKKIDVVAKKFELAFKKAMKIKVNVRTWSLCKWDLIL